MILIADGPLLPLTAARGRKSRPPPTQDGRKQRRLRLRTVGTEESILQKSHGIRPRPWVYIEETRLLRGSQVQRRLHRSRSTTRREPDYRL